MCWQGLSLSLHTNCSSETETQNDTHLDGCLSLCYRVGHPWQPFACLILAVILCPSLLWASRQLLPYSTTTTVCCMSTCSMLPVLLTLARQINNRGFKNKPNINVACNSLDVDRLNKWACNILKWNHSQFEKQNIIYCFGGYSCILGRYWELGKHYPVTLLSILNWQNMRLLDYVQSM